MASSQPSERDREARRHCLVAWPDALAGEYNPSCCRFPKSCSCPPPETQSQSEQRSEMARVRKFLQHAPWGPVTDAYVARVVAEVEKTRPAYPDGEYPAPLHDADEMGACIA